MCQVLPNVFTVISFSVPASKCQCGNDNNSRAALLHLFFHIQSVSGAAHNLGRYIFSPFFFLFLLLTRWTFERVFTRRLAATPLATHQKNKTEVQNDEPSIRFRKQLCGLGFSVCLFLLSFFTSCDSQRCTSVASTKLRGQKMQM